MPPTGSAAPLSFIPPTLTEIAAVAGLCIYYELAFLLFDRDCFVTANLTGPLILVGALSYGAWQMLRAGGACLWTSLFWFRLSTAAYFGLGSYSVLIMNAATRMYIETFNQFFDDELFKLNQIVAACVLVTLIVARFVIKSRSSTLAAALAKAEVDPAQSANRLKLTGLVFLAVGTFVTYAIKMPYDFGWTTFEWPGSIVGLSRMTLVSIFMLTLWSLQSARWALPLITTFTALEMFAQLIMFTKSGPMLTLLMYLMGWLWHKLSVARMAAAGAAVLTLFVTLQPIVTYAREELETRYGNSPAGMEEREAILSSFFDGQSKQTGDEVQRGWTRVTYVTTATYVIRQYDEGHPSDWPELLPAVFIPRFIWPEKPIISDVGQDLYELKTGRRGSAVGVGIFASIYYGGGWWGLVMLVPVYSLIIGLTTVMTFRLMLEGKWHYFPVMMLAMLMGFRADGHFLTDIAGGSVILVSMYAVITVLDRLMFGKASVPQNHKSLNTARWR